MSIPRHHVDKVSSGGVDSAPPACPGAVPAAGAPAPVRVVRAGVDHTQPVPAADAAVPAAVLVAGPPEAPPECVPVLAEVDDEVHLGHGVLVQKHKLSYVRGARGDSIFVKEATKLIFGREDLHGPSVSVAMTALQARRGQEGPDSSQVGSSQQCLQRLHMEASSRGLSREEDSSGQPTAVCQFVNILLQDINKKLDF
ncbi:uncharacterized protein ISCGN_019304 [Ixodes scapularis]